MQTSNVGSINQDRQDPYLDGQHLNAVIDLWLADCADRLDDLGPNGFIGTTKGYADKFIYFREWWAVHGPTCEWRLTRPGLREFERWLRQQESRFGGTLGYHTRNDALRRLRSMFRWAQTEGYIVNVYPADWVPTATGHPPESELIPDSSLRALLDAAVSGSNPVRDLAILAVLIGTGMRRNECASLNIEDITLRDDNSEG
jgi:integrase